MHQPCKKLWKPLDKERTAPQSPVKLMNAFMCWTGQWGKNFQSERQSYYYILAKNAQTEGEKIALASHFPQLKKKKKKICCEPAQSLSWSVESQQAALGEDMEKPDRLRGSTVSRLSGDNLISACGLRDEKHWAKPPHSPASSSHSDGHWFHVMLASYRQSLLNSLPFINTASLLQLRNRASGESVMVKPPASLQTEAPKGATVGLTRWEKQITY